MSEGTYARRRAEIRTYFDSTAVESWKRFASDTPLGRIRSSVREGRARMRAAMLASLPADLSGWRVLDAGCGTGAMAAELARRGADVLGVDLAPEIVRFAADALPPEILPGRVAFRSGDMLDPGLGRFDAVVAMDSLIHYAEGDAVAALARLAARTDGRIVFTFAPRTPALGLMHALGRLFPRSNRAPRIVPVRPAALKARLAAEPALGDWRIERTSRVGHGFYTSEMIAMVRR
ncbi:magnesium protoporphyrin IX methyltransferase [Aureimonas leprariae]|uniref:Magnesium protoporphyrin IX methyltransferase n=1 Tax=Plantimonas leprariae TaxID=2615207 RepID=A0A7V7PQA7_9HYPH|nr:magnesium protoporphyrin IX methyltransferase [Aureimonas leprariae]KAB0680334.1 magnesium protoporphyrin IX methyltransferase [Aureimonas leprariae]